MKYTYLVLMTVMSAMTATSANGQKPGVLSGTVDFVPVQQITLESDAVVDIDVKLTVGADGKVDSVELVHGDMPEFEEAVRKIVEHWHFKPTTELAKDATRTLVIPFQKSMSPNLVALQ